MDPTRSPEPLRIGIVGSGWRAGFFTRIARALPDRFTLVGIAARTPESADRARQRWDVPGYLDAEELWRRQRPDLMVTSLPQNVNAPVVARLVSAGARVLSETPPAPDLAGLRELWREVGAGERVQVAEQYPFLPGHAARAALVRRGLIGDVSSVHVSSTHGYHAVALIRALLGGTGGGPVTVSATRFVGPLVDPLVRDAWTDDDTPREAGTVLATLDFGGRSGLYDFTDNQWHNRLRHRRVLVRGSHGEIADDHVVRYAGPRTILEGRLTRGQLGHDLNLEGHDTELISFDGTVAWRNRFVGARFSDEEIAIASVLAASGDWARDGAPAPYPLAEACQDQLVGLAIEESVRTGAPVRTEVESWAGRLWGA